MENNNKDINENISDKSRKNLTSSSGNVSTYQNSAFGNNVFYTLAKRAERATTAIHMVSKFIPRDNSLRSDMRKHSLRVIKKLYKCITCEAYDQQFFLEEALVSIEYIVTTLSIARATGLLSEMNASILEKALHGFGTQIYQQWQIALRYEQDFSDTIAPTIDKDTLLEFLQETVDFEATSNENFQRNLQEAMKNKTTFKTTQNDIESKRQDKRQVEPKTKESGAGERRKKIQEIIKIKGEVTIKDIAIRITNCSEKTLQRDLVKMIKDNVVEKEGDKRWSIYRIKDNI